MTTTLENMEKEIAKFNFNMKKFIRKIKRQKPAKDAKVITVDELLAMSDEQLNAMQR